MIPLRSPLLLAVAAAVAVHVGCHSDDPHFGCDPEPCTCDDGKSGTRYPCGAGVCDCGPRPETGGAPEASKESSVDSAPEGAPFAAPCSVDSDCASRICLPVGQCSHLCATAYDCGDLAWECGPVLDYGTVCQCPQRTTETCNGADDDCDGKADDGAVCPPGQTCTGGQCR